MNELTISIDEAINVKEQELDCIKSQINCYQNIIDKKRNEKVSPIDEEIEKTNIKIKLLEKLSENKEDIDNIIAKNYIFGLLLTLIPLVLSVINGYQLLNGTNISSLSTILTSIGIIGTIAIPSVFIKKNRKEIKVLKDTLNSYNYKNPNVELNIAKGELYALETSREHILEEKYDEEDKIVELKCKEKAIENILDGLKILKDSLLDKLISLESLEKIEALEMNEAAKRIRTIEK